MRILLAEDNRFSRDYLHTLLASHGAQVDVCGNGDEALQALAAGAYDVVLMDLRMPVCSGLAALGKLRASGSTHPPVIGMTAAPEDCAAAREAGMEDCFVKPVRATALLERLCQLQGRAMTAASERVLVLDAEMRQELAIELPRHVQRLRRLLSERDRRALAEEAHRINGTAALCGFERLRSQAAALESSLRAGSTDGLDEGVQSLVAELEHVCSGL